MHYPLPNELSSQGLVGVEIIPKYYIFINETSKN